MITRLALGAATAVLVALAFAPGANATVAGTSHDLSGGGYGTDQICEPCHTPHFADTTVNAAPLWNHQVTSSSFTLYSSGTLNATVNQPTGVSKLCLSCHDGTIAVDNFGGQTTGTVFISTGHRIGTDLTDDHPISFTYDSALATADGELVDPGSVGLPLFGGELECATCHDVHGAGFPDFLRMSNSGSALCLECHIK